MIIRKVKIYGFGRFMNCEFEPDKNNFLSAAKGLMTDTELFFEFVRAMLYGLSARDGTGTRFKYMPEEMYDNLGRRVRYGGELFYDACGKNYQLSCLWGNSKAEDLCRIIDTKSGRDVKIETGKTVGEKTLHISEAAFVSAVKATGAAVNSGDEGVYSIGKLSALMGLNDGKPSPKEVRLGLENKLLELTDPKTKNGKLDRLVINKMNMRNALSRIGEKDGRFAKLRASLETAEAELANIDAELADSKRTFGLCDAAKSLLAKDRIMAVYDQQTGIMKQLNFAEAELNRLNKTRLLPSLLLPICLFLGGNGLMALGMTTLRKSVFGWPVEIIGALVGVLAIVLAVFAVFKFVNRFNIESDGRMTTAEAEVARLKGEINAKNEELLSLLGDLTAGEIEQKWRESEDIMRNASETERRYAVLKQSDELEEILNSLEARREPLLERIEDIGEEIKAIGDAAGVSFAEAYDSLESIDDKIKKLSDEVSALKIALNACKNAEKSFVTFIAEPLCAKASDIYRKVCGGPSEFRIDDDFNILARCDRPDIAVLAVRGVISSYVTASSDRQFMFLGDLTAEKRELEVFMRAAGIGQMVVLN